MIIDSHQINELHSIMKIFVQLYNAPEGATANAENEEP